MSQKENQGFLIKVMVENMRFRQHVLFRGLNWVKRIDKQNQTASWECVVTAGNVMGQKDCGSCYIYVKNDSFLLSCHVENRHEAEREQCEHL